MNPAEDYIAINRESWNNRVTTHFTSDFYQVADFINGATSLNSIELELLGDIKGKSILHLQCHFGQDTIALSRLGAQVTGVDFSDKAIESAQLLAQQTQSSAQFICCDLYDLEQHLDQQFDLVFTSYGTITWLPDLNKWAHIITRFLKPQGQFIFAEFHPFVWMYNPTFDALTYPYFNEAPIIETENGTYADKNAALSQASITWNHSLSEVMSSLLRQKLELKDFQEYNYSPYAIFPDMHEVALKKYRIKAFDHKLPLVYSLVFLKK